MLDTYGNILFAHVGSCQGQSAQRLPEPDMVTRQGPAISLGEHLGSINQRPKRPASLLTVVDDDLRWSHIGLRLYVAVDIGCVRHVAGMIRSQILQLGD